MYLDLKWNPDFSKNRDSIVCPNLSIITQVTPLNAQNTYQVHAICHRLLTFTHLTILAPGPWHGDANCHARENAPNTLQVTRFGFFTLFRVFHSNRN